MLHVTEMANGAIIERIDESLQAVVKNIQDPNTDPKAVRKVLFEIIIKPNAEREVGNVGISVKEKLAPMKDLGTIIFMGFDRLGQPYAYENNPRQPELFEDTHAKTGTDSSPATVHPIREVK